MHQSRQLIHGHTGALLVLFSSSTFAIYGDDPINSAIKGGIVAIAFTILGLAARIIYRQSQKASKQITPISRTLFNQGKKAFEKKISSREKKILSIDDRYYLRALEEINASTLDQGLWLKCFTLSDGNPEKQKSEYI